MHLVKSLHSGALNEVFVALRNTPVDLAIQLPRLWHSKVVHLLTHIIFSDTFLMKEPKLTHESCKGSARLPQLHLNILDVFNQEAVRMAKQHQSWKQCMQQSRKLRHEQ